MPIRLPLKAVIVAGEFPYEVAESGVQGEPRSPDGKRGRHAGTLNRRGPTANDLFSVALSVKCADTCFRTIRTRQLPAVPGTGVIGMTLLFSGAFSGIGLLWDRQLGFLKETLVAPVPRIEIMLGRTLGSATVAVIQGLLVLVVCVIAGFRPVNLVTAPGALVTMMLIAILFCALGTVIGSLLQSMQLWSGRTASDTDRNDPLRVAVGSDSVGGDERAVPRPRCRLFLENPTLAGSS
jgi:hypothetical protein